MKQTYIDRAKQKVQDRIKKIKNKMGRRDLALLLGSVLLGVTSAYCIFGLANLTLAGAFMTATAVYNRYRNKRMNKDLLENLEKENKHLEGLETANPEDKTKTNMDRACKIYNLENKRFKENSAAKKLNIATNIGSLSTIGAAVGCAFAPALWFIPAITLATTGILGGISMNKSEAVNNLDLRINNLKRDRDIVNINRRTNNGGGANTNTNTRTNTNTNARTNTRTNTANNTTRTQTPPPLPQRPQQTTTQPQPSTPKPTNPKREAAYKKAINRYVNKLAGFKNNYLSNQKVKK